MKRREFCRNCARRSALQSLRRAKQAVEDENSNLSNNLPGDSFHWENKLALRIREDEELLVLCKLFENFLEFYELDYTLNVFTHEVNSGDNTQTENLRELTSSARRR